MSLAGRVLQEETRGPAQGNPGEAAARTALRAMVGPRRALVRGRDRERGGIVGVWNTRVAEPNALASRGVWKSIISHERV